MDEYTSPTNTVPQQPRRRSTVGHWVTIIALLALLGISAALNLVLLVFAIAGSGIHTAESPRKFHEELLQGSGREKVVRIDAYGIISFRKGGGGIFQEEGLATRIIKQIEAAEKDDHVIAILLVVDSPGGGVTASDIIYERLLEFKKSGKGDRKVVVLMRDLAASGGYYISAAADKIIAHRTTITGSIGVLLSTLNIKGLGEKIGIKDVTIKSGKNKDLLNPFREVTAAQTNMLQGVIDDLYSRFVSVIARSRGMSAEKVREFADGSIFTSPQALELGLIDEIGYEDTAVEQLRAITGVEKFKIVRYKRFRPFFDLFASRLNPGIDLPIPARWKTEGPRFQYLWQPEL